MSAKTAAKILISNLVSLHTFFYFLRTSNFRLRLGCSKFFGDFSLKLFLNCSHFLTFPNSGLVAQNNKKALRNTCLLLFHPAIYQKNHQTVNTESADVTNFLITLQGPYDPANSNKSLHFVNLSDENFSLVIVLSLFLIFKQISAWVFL